MLQYTRLSSAEAPFFRESWHLYESAFPCAERRSLACHLAAMAAEPLFFCIALHENNKVVGILFYWLFENCVYVEHLAIAPAFRGMGYGRAALASVRSHGLPVILEIEPVTDAVTAGRLRFYERVGYHRLADEHYQLPYHEGEPPLRLELLSYPTPAGAALVASFEKDFAAKPMLYRDSSMVLRQPK